VFSFGGIEYGALPVIYSFLDAKGLKLW
jgi:hypothetical protein